MALGLLNISLSEFYQLTVKEVYVILKAKKDENLAAECNARRSAYYQVAPHWSGLMPLKHFWQLWVIPEIDGDINELIGKSSVTSRPENEEERQMRERLQGRQYKPKQNE
jgi:hypothetical protein